MKKPNLIRLVLAALAALLLAGFAAACGDDDEGGGGTKYGGADTAGKTDSKAIKSNPENAKVALTIGSKNFTEQKILGEIYTQALAAAGYKATGEFNLGDQSVALKALESGQIDAYPEYTGTALTAFFGVKADAVPKDPKVAFDETKAGFAKDGITALPATPFTSSNEVAVTKETAEKLGLTNISDLKGKEGDLTLYGSPECRQRTDCLLGLQQVYGLDFGKFTPVDVALRHEVLEKGQADVSIVFTTDPQIKRNGEVLLKDDKGMFPPYNSTLLVKDATLEKAGPDFAGTVNKVSPGLTNEVMQELNARVDLDKQTPEAVAKAYLQEAGFTS